MDCPCIPRLSYGAFSERLHEKVAGQRVPISGSLELTFGCNLRCVHCYLDSCHDGLPGRQELSYEEICSVIDQIVDEGCLWLLLTGGEPLLRPDFQAIYTYAKRKGLILTLFTNGTLVTPEMADFLAEWRPFAVEITLYGRTQATYERVTGVPGSHARCLRGIELLLERKIPLKLKTMLLTLNRHELDAMAAYAEGLGVEFRFDPVVNAGLDGSPAPAAYRLPPEEAVAVEAADPVRRERWPEWYRTMLGADDDGRLYTCGAGRHSFHIDPFGQLGLCTTAREPVYDLRRGSFREGWSKFLPTVLEQEPGEGYECGGCPLRPLCPQCPGWAQLEHGNPNKRVEYLCRLAHLRAEAFGRSSSWGYPDNEFSVQERRQP